MPIHPQTVTESTEKVISLMMMKMTRPVAMVATFLMVVMIMMDFTVTDCKIQNPAMFNKLYCQQ